MYVESKDSNHIKLVAEGMYSVMQIFSIKAQVKGQKRRPPNLQLKTNIVWLLIFSRKTEKLHRPTYYDLSTDV